MGACLPCVGGGAQEPKSFPSPTPNNSRLSKLLLFFLFLLKPQDREILIQTRS